MSIRNSKKNTQSCAGRRRRAVRCRRNCVPPHQPTQFCYTLKPSTVRGHGCAVLRHCFRRQTLPSPSATPIASSCLWPSEACLRERDFRRSSRLKRSEGSCGDEPHRSDGGGRRQRRRQRRWGGSRIWIAGGKEREGSGRRGCQRGAPGDRGRRSR